MKTEALLGTETNGHGLPTDDLPAVTEDQVAPPTRRGLSRVQLIGFGQDHNKELYALVFEPGATGHVMRITAPARRRLPRGC